MSSEFKTTTHGKWILVGEHAVLRGYPALVFPIRTHTLTLHYSESSPTQTSNPTIQTLLEFGAKELKLPFQELKGSFSLKNTIPIGKGLGASAALCVAVARFLAFQQGITPEEVPLVAKSLENLFHGQSSGLDIAGVSTEASLFFQKGSATPFKPTWTPSWYLSACDQMGKTSHCIAQVAERLKTNPSKGHAIDEQMAASVQRAYHALTTPYTSESFQNLSRAIDEARECFEQWGLVTDSLKTHMATLKAAGAIAYKPTGSGRGGYVLSLWNAEPQGVPFELIRLNPPTDNTPPLP